MSANHTHAETTRQDGDHRATDRRAEASRSPAPYAGLMALQHTAGNRGVGRLLGGLSGALSSSRPVPQRECASCPAGGSESAEWGEAAPALRRAPAAASGTVAERHGEAPQTVLSTVPLTPRLWPKLVVGSVDDPMERDADRLADRVMRMPDPALTKLPLVGRHVVQRACAACQHEIDGREEVRRRATSAERLDGASAPPIVQAVLADPGDALDPVSRRFFEPRFGHDFSRVRIHSDGRGAQSAVAVNALAYTVGRHIAFASGRFAPETDTGRRLLAHELAHVLQQATPEVPPVHDRPVAAAAQSSSPEFVGEASRSGTPDVGHSPVLLARAPAPPPRRPRAMDLDHLKNLMKQLLKALTPSTRTTVNKKTIAIGLVEAEDQNGVAFQTLVWVVSGNWTNAELAEQALQLGIQRWERVTPREAAKREKGDKGEKGAPEDAEQLLIEGQDQFDMTLLGMAVSREPCVDCQEALLDAGIRATWLSPKERGAKFGRRNTFKAGSEGKQRARAEIDAAFAPAVVARGAEQEAGLGPKAPVWGALNVLDMRELYNVLEEAGQAGRLEALHRGVRKAQGVFVNRLLAPMFALELRKESLSGAPDKLKLWLVSSMLDEVLAQLPGDQRALIESHLAPQLRAPARPKPKTPTPRRADPPKEKPGEKKGAEEAGESSFIKPIVKAFAAVGLTLASLEAVKDGLALLASAIFTDVVLRIVAQGTLEVSTKEAVKRAVEETIKKEAPKFRVLTEEVRKRIGEAVGEELGPEIDRITHSVRQFL
jgi:hypothetical protein